MKNEKINWKTAPATAADVQKTSQQQNETMNAKPFLYRYAVFNCFVESITMHRHTIFILTRSVCECEVEKERHVSVGIFRLFRFVKLLIQHIVYESLNWIEAT